MQIAILALLANTLVTPTGATVPVASERAVITDTGTCTEGPHDHTRTRRLPGVAAMNDRPHSHDEEAYVHCPETSPSQEP